MKRMLVKQEGINPMSMDIEDISCPYYEGVISNQIPRYPQEVYSFSFISLILVFLLMMFVILLNKSISVHIIMLERI